MKHAVYTIACPDTKNVVYVGLSQNTEMRFRAHLNTDSSASPRLGNWIVGLRSQNKKPIFSVIFETENRREASAKELEMIVYYSALNPVLNSFGNPQRKVIRKAQAEYEEAVKKASLILAKSVAKKYSLDDNFIIKLKIT